jgi:hypothetical protein
MMAAEEVVSKGVKGFSAGVAMIGELLEWRAQEGGKGGGVFIGGQGSKCERGEESGADGGIGGGGQH